MAEKAEKKSESKEAPAEGAKPAKKGGIMSKTPVLLGGVMLIEAGILFGGFKMFGGSSPKAAPGAELVSEEGHEESAEGGHGEAATEGSHGEAAAEGGHGAATTPTKSKDKKKSVEISVIDTKASNTVTGRKMLFDVSIYVVTKGVNEDKVKTALKDREALIKDRIRTIIAQSDPEKLLGSSEPGLETLRRQVKYQLDEIMGEGLIDEVLVPRCIPFRADF